MPDPTPPDDQERMDARRRFLEARMDAFTRVAPAEFIATDPARLAPPADEALDVLMPRDCVGVMFTGATGHGKSRTAWLLARKHYLRRSVVLDARTGIDLATDIAEAYKEGFIASLRARLQKADILLIDDLFKGNWTPGVESTVFNVIDYRGIHRLPTIITTNLDGKNIKKLLSPDVRDPFLRRIGREFYRHFVFDRKPREPFA